MADVFADTSLLRQDGTTILGSEALQGKATFLYFTAQWCPPSRTFNPHVKTFYRRAKEAGFDIEIVFISSDTSADEANNYFNEKHADYLMMPYDDPAGKAIYDKLEITHIPTMMIIDANGDPAGNPNDTRNFITNHENFNPADFQQHLQNAVSGTGVWVL